MIQLPGHPGEDVLSNLTIWFVAGTLGQGGAERQLYYQLRTLREAGANPQVLSLTTGEHWESPIRESGVPITWVGSAKTRAGRLLRIVREVRRGRPDILQSQHFFANPYVAVAGRLTGVPGIGAVRSDAFREVANSGKMGLRLPRLLAINSERAVANAIASGVPEERCHLLPNVVDTDWFRPVDRARGSDIRILGVGRFVPPKRFDRFIDAVATVRDMPDAPSIRATICGEGPLREDLERRARSAGLTSEELDLPGSVADPREFYRGSDLLLLTSDFEGAPNVLLEAASSGLPVIATRVGGVAELVEHGRTGLLVDPGDTAGLANALSSLARDPERLRAMGGEARRRVLATRSLDRLPALLGELYRKVLR